MSRRPQVIGLAIQSVLAFLAALPPSPVLLSTAHLLYSSALYVLSVQDSGSGTFCRLFRADAPPPD